jgi:undecaprenyl-diphosphatase
LDSHHVGAELGSAYPNQSGGKMSLFHLFILAVLQGLTEFLPVSSSGHLILLPSLTGLQDQGQVLDIAVHVGTLGAVILYFRQDSMKALVGLGHLVMGKRETAQARLAWLLVIGTIPVVIFGIILKFTGLDAELRSITVIGWTMLGFGLVLYVADQKGGQEKSDDDWGTKDAIIMGLCQALALVPGTSRSGITISASRALGYNREDSAKIAMLMSIPAILASGTYLGIEVAATADIQAATDGAIAAIMSFFAALLALSIMMRMLKSVSYTPYVIYRVILGVVLLIVAYS